MDPRQYLREAYRKGIPVRDIAKALGISKAAVKNRAKRDPLCPVHGGLFQNVIMDLDSTLEGETQMKQATKADLDALREHCEKHGLPFDQRTLWWHKTKEFSVSFYDKQKVKEQREELEKMKERVLEAIKNHAPSYKTVKREKITDGHLLVVDPADIHIRKFCHVDETGYNYNSELATAMTIAGVEGIIQKANGYPIDRILLVIGNDVLHTDNAHNTTTSGTRQDVHGQWWQGAEDAEMMYVTMIDRLLSIADVDVIFNPSNHDYHSGWFLTRMLKNWYRHTKNITFDDRIRHRKYYQYHQNMIGTTHGDGAKPNDMPLLMAQEAPQIWANTVHRYIYQHHIHHRTATRWQAVKDYPGITLQTLRSPSAPDGWHDRNGYTGAPQAIEGFIHHPTGGQVACLSHIFSTRG